MSPRKPPELTFQEHIAAYLAREHGYGILDQASISDKDHFIAEDLLWSFLKTTQNDTIKKLEADYGTDAREEVFKALRQELERTPLWMLLRHGLQVRGLEFRLFYPKPRSEASAATAKYSENRITFRPHFYFGDTNKEIDFAFFLNGLPIVLLEVKHEKNQNVHDAVVQYVNRDHHVKIFQYPFLYLATDTSDVMAATDPRQAENFRWHNLGLNNTADSKDEYPVEFLYKEVLSPDQIFEALSFFLLRVPEQHEEEGKPAQAAFTIYPRYHQSRLVRNVSRNIGAHFDRTGNIGKKYLAEHSAGSGKTLSICWLADRLHSLYRTGSSEKLTDIIFILTDRRTLDKNIRDDIEQFTHLKDVVGIAEKADDLPRYLRGRKPIIVTTIQKFTWVLEELQKNEGLKDLRVAFLIDEAHRSQEGQMAAAIRAPFRKAEEQDGDEPADDPEEETVRIIREHDRNQLFVAFTATPSPATVSLFGKPFDMYTEAEAIAEGYIVDVATGIISYKTLYNLHCSVVPGPAEEKVYPKGIVSKALKNIAFQDEELIQYKAEVMLRIFDDDVKSLIDGRAKAMIVASSRVAGLLYYNIIKEKLKEREAGYKILFAFSDFVHPGTGENITEFELNGLEAGEVIEDRFEGDEYRLIVVANKFQTGFDQPLLAGMFLDKPVLDRNAVQTVSRLNRSCPAKKDVVVVDFTNNAKEILRAFSKYRKGTPFTPVEPDPTLCTSLYDEMMKWMVFSRQDIIDFTSLLRTGTDAQVQFQTNALRTRFCTVITDGENRKNFVILLDKFVRTYHFLTCFFSYGVEIKEAAVFAEYVGPQLIKAGGVSDLLRQVRNTEVIKASVQYQGVKKPGGPVKLVKGGKGGGPVQIKVSVQDMIDEIKRTYDISDEEALYIKQVTAEKVADQEIKKTVQIHQDDSAYLEGPYRGQVNGEIQSAYDQRGRYAELADPKYTETGGIFDIMAVTVISTHLTGAA